MVWLLTISLERLHLSIYCVALWHYCLCWGFSCASFWPFQRFFLRWQETYVKETQTGNDVVVIYYQNKYNITVSLHKYTTKHVTHSSFIVNNAIISDRGYTKPLVYWIVYPILLLIFFLIYHLFFLSKTRENGLWQANIIPHRLRTTTRRTCSGNRSSKAPFIYTLYISIY